MRYFSWVLLLLVAGCTNAQAPQATLDALAGAYVRLTLKIGAHEDGYIDAYFGPPEWQEEANAAPGTTAELKSEADRILDSLSGLERAALPPDNQHRVDWLLANVASARFRVDMIEGLRFPFREEAERLFAITPDLRPLQNYDPILERIEALLPGDAPLSERVEEFRALYTIPQDRLTPVMDAAIAECRERTLANLNLPEDEQFNMEFVTGQNLSAYNWYQGGNQSLIQINTELPVRIDDALRLGCHEGYPGHHFQQIKIEQKYPERGWVEFSVLPLFAPASPLLEGGANYGIDLAFPNGERAEFEMATLYPLAGLDPATAESFETLRLALSELSGASRTIAAMYLDGEISRERAVDLTQRYQLNSEARAERSVAFAETYRSYVINYSSGEDLVQAFITRGAENDAARWETYERIFSASLLPNELAP
jgi:hypothetical protein